MKILLNYFLFSAFLLSSCSLNTEREVEKVRDYITENWPRTVKVQVEDSLHIIGLPKPYNVPCVDGGHFREMYYWDTFFTNVGLIEEGNVPQAKNNIDNILFLIDRYGFMPNGSLKPFLNRSQPPYASMMVRDIYESTKDKKWLANACQILEKEYYSFWMQKRMAPNGLNFYSNNATDKECIEFYDFLFQRFPDFNPGQRIDVADKIRIGSHFLAEAESGWDFSPRFNSEAEYFNPIDLNSNLYIYEKNFAFFYSELGKSGVNNWLEKAFNRKKLINKYCFNPDDGLFYDYNYEKNYLSKVFSAASLSVLFAGIATEEQALIMKNELSKLEFKHGISACEPGPRKYTYQWDYPNGWAALHYITIKGLDNYGYKQDAKRIAKKYVNTVVQNFKKTNNLWEKYNVKEGDLSVSSEYEMPPFIGWTAGIFVYASNYLLN